ncbi:uncharacterized protein LOC131256699 [Magnolia sinica]|uniref:uncharacterized protein LOC131256699 n=1 Tax=Magnolia sinica TaxID=86752 RepID=UPI0026592CD2|nr:uncharacterized protein LOC131256699 [Magnolia sinica]
MDEAGAPSIAKHLASCNTRTRSQALAHLTTFFSSHPSISDSDMLKIWKGLFYSLWHADKLPVQLRLIQRLSSLLLSLHPSPICLQYLRCFITTIRREWAGIDSLRLDKFYLLIRRFLRHLFLLLKSNSWDLELSNRLMDVLVEMTLLPTDSYPAQGVNYHISEAFLEELKEFLPLTADVLDALLKPFFSVLEKSTDKVLVSKIRKSMFDCLLENGKKKISDLGKGGTCVDSDDEDAEKFGIIALKMGFSAKFFKLASDPDAVQANRKVLFGLHEEFLKLEKDFEKLGVEISLPEVNVGLDTELVDVAGAPSEQVEGNPQDRKASKKSKKAKSKKQSEVGDKESKSKKKKKKKNGSSDSETTENGHVATVNGSDIEKDDIGISFDESVISNLQKQFEKVAAEAGMEVDSTSSCAAPMVVANGKASKKRKRAKIADGKVSVIEGSVGGSAAGKSGEKSAKKVRFSMKSNLVWKPHSPLPPQSLRLPPSATPRGSALKKGVPPGPVREAPLAKKVKHRGSGGKKGRKITKTVSPAIKRLRKLQSLSA